MEINELKVKIDNFEGPMDLLLHLVEKEKLNIYELNISKIIDEYLEIINNAIENSLELKVEFLIIATELVEIKSLAILNKKEKKEKEEALSQKILEYKRYKEIVEELEKMENEYRISYTKEGKEVIKVISDDIDLTDITPLKLYNEYKEILNKNMNNELKLDLEVKYSLNDGIDYVKSILIRYKKPISFQEIFKNIESKYKIVMCFLAILEMYKMNIIDIIEEEKFYIKIKL